jgi:hypothetical protein
MGRDAKGSEATFKIDKVDRYKDTCRFIQKQTKKA